MVAWDYALWLLPEGEATALLAPRLNALADEFAAPHFAPHVTAYGGRAVIDAGLTAICARLARALAPTALEVSALTRGDFLFQTLFLALNTTLPLALWFEQVLSDLGNPKNYRLKPHLSLLYAPLDDAAKQVLAEREQAWFAQHCPRVLCFDRLALVTPGAGGWHDFDGWREVAAWPLGEPAAP